VHSFRDFKGFRQAGLNLFQPVTLLVGKNASGKTNAIEAIELLANLAHGRPLYEITDIGRGGPDTFELRGGLPGCPRGGGSRFRLGFDQATVRFQQVLQGVAYGIEIEVDPHPRIVAESLTIGARTLFDARTKSSAEPEILTAQYDNFARGGNKPRTDLPADRSVVFRYGDFTSDLRTRQAPVRERHRDACGVIDNLNRYLHASFVFDPVPRNMRAYERVGQRILLRDGSNLSSVLYALQQGDETGQATLQRILERIRQLPEEPFLGFDFIVTRQQDILLAFKETEDGPPLDARVMSDGTLRRLAVLTALETVEPQSRIIIEEFDNGLHPSRVGVLADALWDCAKRRRLNVLATTHNPATLNALDAEQLAGVVLCFWDGEQAASRLMPLLEVPRADVLFEQGQLGDLVTRNIVERHLAPRFTESQRHKALEWLDSLGD
jgi:predicted ATPase